MNISIAIHGAPTSAGGVHSALKFARAALDAGHKIGRVFFYHDAVLLADAFAVTPQGDSSGAAGWVQLKEAHDLELVVCIAAALKRGLLSEEESRRYGRSGFNLHPAFELSGLGLLIDAMVTSDRFVTFAS